MANLFRIKPVKNKANGQLSFVIPKRKLSKQVKNILKTDKIPMFKFKLEGLE